jgi:hypothetical protein
VSVAELVRREPSPDAGGPSGVSQQRADPGGGAGAAAGGSAEHTEKRADRQPGADGEPRIELLPGPAVPLDRLMQPYLDRSDYKVGRRRIRADVFSLAEAHADGRLGLDQAATLAPGRGWRTVPVTAWSLTDVGVGAHSLFISYVVGSSSCDRLATAAETSVVNRRASPSVRTPAIGFCIVTRLRED